MRLKPEHLRNHLKQGMAPIYALIGEEPLQLRDSADMIRKAARYHGFEEREVYTVESGFDWQQLANAADSLSLFASQRLLELRIPNGKPGDQGGKALREYAAHPPEDTVLLVHLGKVESQSQKSKWFKALEDAGVVIPVWPIEGKALEGWLMQRAARYGLSLVPPGVQMLAERVEGNLLAADQELEKLALLYGKDGKPDPAGEKKANRETISISVEQLEEAISDSARYSLFGLVDTLLAGQSSKGVRMLNGLRQEGTADAVVLWAFAREVRSLMTIQREAERTNLESALKKQRVFAKRKALVSRAAQSRSVEQWMQLLQLAHRTDRIIKGVDAGDSWELLREMALLLSNPALKPLAA